MPLRDYQALLKQAEQYGPHHAIHPRIVSTQTPLDRMKIVCDLIWDHFGLDQTGRPAYSWIGFYEKIPGKDEMVLVARRDKPACSPIGLFGMCGRGWQERRPILIPDVSTLGANYIACDPKDRSEIVLPIMNEDGSCWGVLDGDSYELNAFDENDVVSLTKLLAMFGFGTATAQTLTL